MTRHLLHFVNHPIHLTNYNIEAEVVKQYGGKVHLVPRISGAEDRTLATSEIVDKICALQNVK